MRPLPLATGADLGPFTGRRYSGSRVLLGFFRFGRLGLSVPMERFTSGFSSGSGSTAESSGRTFGFLGFTLGRCTHWRTPLDCLAVSALGYPSHRTD